MTLFHKSGNVEAYRLANGWTGSLIFDMSAACYKVLIMDGGAMVSKHSRCDKNAALSIIKAYEEG